MLQVIATATIAATVGLGGLGRFLIDGQAVRDYAQMAAGAILVAVLALVIDLVLSLVQRWVVSPGLTGAYSGPRDPAPRTPAPNHPRARCTKPPRPNQKENTPMMRTKSSSR